MIALATSASIRASEPRLTFVGHSTVLIELDGVRLLTDPLLRHRVAHLRRLGGAVDEQLYREVDAALISHLHWDHLDLPSLRLLDPATRLIVPRGAARLLRSLGLRHVVELGVGEAHAIGPVEVVATPANHSGFRPPLGPRGEALGFLVRGSQRIYFAGDTDLFPEMADLGRLGALDVALLPVWGWGPTLGAGHLDPRRAAVALRMLRPRLAMPIHWGALCPFGMGWLRPRFLAQPPRAFADHAARLAPAIDVTVVGPGQSLALLD